MTSPSASAARTLLAALVRLGVRHLVLAPGSRSAPLAYAAAEAAEAGLLELHVRVDEREAAFCALGLARGARDGAPVAVVTTSGTAVANLLPAVLEAHHGGVPLLLLTADRPHELRGTGASQTIDQVGIFGGAVRLAVDVPAPDARASGAGEPAAVRELVHLAARAVDAATGGRAPGRGPVHLNLAYRDPLVPDADDASPWPDVAPPHVARAGAGPVASPWSDDVLAAPGTLVVAGDGDDGRARALAEGRGWPLLAEAVSGSAGGPALVPAHAHVLAASPLAADVRRVVVVGRPTLSRPVQRLVAREDVEVVVVAPGGGPWSDAPRGADHVLPEVPAAWLVGCDPGARAEADAWAAAWRAAGAAAAAAVDATLALPAPAGPGAGEDATALTAEQAVRALADALGPDDVLVVGSSNPVRDLDLVHRWVEPPCVVANRGVAGIDGIVSTAVGVALALRADAFDVGSDALGAGADAGAVAPGAGVDTPGAGADTPGTRADASGTGTHRHGPRPVRALLGDLTFLHGAGGLAAARGEARPHLQLVVVNDAGGSIFTGLEHGALAEAAPARAAAVERVFGTPHDVDLGALCAAHGVAHARVTDAASLGRALADPAPGLSVVEVPVDRSGRRARASAVAAALATTLATPLATTLATPPTRASVPDAPR